MNEKIKLPYAVGVAGAAASVVLERISLQPSRMYSSLTPYASKSTVNNEINGPKVHVEDNEAYRMYETGWLVQSMGGVRLWLQICHNIRDVGRVSIDTLKNWGAFTSLIKDAFPFINISELTIPMIYAEGNTTKFRMTTLSEYIQHQPRGFTPFRFFLHIVEITLFGFVCDLSTLEALRLDGNTILSYLKERLRGGEFSPRFFI